MYKNNKFTKNELFSVINKFSELLEKEVKGYLIGGLAMIFHGHKGATKDVDIVFESVEYANLFEEGMRLIDFKRDTQLVREYENLEAQAILDGPEGYRFDIFIKCVCNCLTLSKGMKNRAKEIPLKGNFKLYAICPEDIFLFKSMTSRDDDLEDMATIVGHGLNWESIEDELKSQSEYWKLLPRHFLKLLELEKKYKIVTPLIKKLEKEAEIGVGIGLLLNYIEKNPISIEYAIGKLDKDDEDFGLTVIQKMKEYQLIKEVKEFLYIK